MEFFFECYTELFEIELFLYANRIVWNGIVFDIKTLLTPNGIVWIRIIWLNWIPWNRNVFWKLNSVLVINWIIWKRTLYLYKN